MEKSLVSDMADMKNQFKSVTSTGAKITKIITKVNTVVAQQKKSWAKVASKGSKGKTFDNNFSAIEVAKKVNKEINETIKAIEIG